MTRRRGFSLLEVMIALGILSISLVSISGISSGSYAASEYAQGVTQATLLARSKMIDIEEEMWEDGSFPDDDKELDGDFESDGFDDFRWSAKVRKIDVDIGQMIGSLLGGDVNPENMAEHVGGFISALGGAGSEEAVDQVGGSDLANMLKGDQLEVIFKQVGDNLAESIREIELTIEWGGKRDRESIKFVQYIVTTGRINTPAGANARLPLPANGQPLPGQGAAAGFPGSRGLPTGASLPGGRLIPGGAASRPFGK